MVSFSHVKKHRRKLHIEVYYLWLWTRILNNCHRIVYIFSGLIHHHRVLILLLTLVPSVEGCDLLRNLSILQKRGAGEKKQRMTSVLIGTVLNWVRWELKQNIAAAAGGARGALPVAATTMRCGNIAVTVWPARVGIQIKSRVALSTYLVLTLKTLATSCRVDLNNRKMYQNRKKSLT